MGNTTGNTANQHQKPTKPTKIRRGINPEGFAAREEAGVAIPLRNGAGGSAPRGGILGLKEAI